MKYIKIIFLFCLVLSLDLYCQELENFHEQNVDPLRTASEVHPEAVPEKVLKLQQAEVLIADYELIRKDFPDIAHFTDPEIDNWLIKETAYISQSQQAQEVVNSAIAVEDAKRVAHRPPEYGRALVYEVDGATQKRIGVIDVKGAGGINPSHASHRSGTMTLGESLREFSYEKMVTNVVHHSAIEKKVVGSYAVIYPGFDVIHQDGSRSAAGFYLRQGHRRWTQAENLKNTGEVRGNGWMDTEWRGKYKSLLNKYGIFANENYQGTIKNDLFDFGHYIIRDDLPTSNTKIKVPFKQWGFDIPTGQVFDTGGDRWKFSKMDRPWIWAHDTAEAYVAGTATRHHVWQNHYNLLKPVQEKLKEVPRLYDESIKIGFKVDPCSKYFDPWGR